MLTTDQIVTQLPLEKLWTASRNLNITREKYVDRQFIKELLNKTPVEFVVADIGSKLKWIPVDQCYEFWKSEVREHITDDPNKVYLENFSGNYAYIASQWTGLHERPIILLEKIH